MAVKVPEATAAKVPEATASKEEDKKLGLILL
jgi:hypothetical protein